MIDDQVTLQVDDVLKTTKFAALCLIDGEEHWLPWSKMDEGSEIETEGDAGKCYIPRWLAIEKGIEI